MPWTFLIQHIFALLNSGRTWDQHFILEEIFVSIVLIYKCQSSGDYWYWYWHNNREIILLYQIYFCENWLWLNKFDITNECLTYNLYVHFADPVYADIMYKEALREYKRQPQEQAPKAKFSFFIKIIYINL